MTASPQARSQAADPRQRGGIPEPAGYGDPQRNGLTADDLFDGLTEHLFFTLGQRASAASPHDLYMALSYAVRDRLMTRHLATRDALRSDPSKVVAYLSAEFLIGPQLGNNLLMLGIRDAASEALARFGVSDLDEILDQEEEPGLGNGGLGRLALGKSCSLSRAVAWASGGISRPAMTPLDANIAAGILLRWWWGFPTMCRCRATG